MKHLTRWTSTASIALLWAYGTGAAPTQPAAEQPATIRVEVAPQAVAPGGQARVTLTLEPAEGVKVNRYPKIRFNVAARPGLVSGAEATLGNEGPPPVDQTGGNYFEVVDPLTLELALDRRAPTGSHELEGQLVFYYCVTKSGYCAPKKTPVKIPLNVR